MTHLQTDEGKFPSQQSFGKIGEFSSGQSAMKVTHWVCCCEKHKDSGIHFHCAIKLIKLKKWVSVKERIRQAHNIVPNFIDSKH